MSQTKPIMNPLPIPRSNFKSRDPRLLPLIEFALANGAKLIRDGKHFVFRLPSGRVFTTPKTPRDYRGVLNNLSDIRRALREEGLLK